MSYCIRTDKIIGMRMSEKYNSYTIILIKLVLEEINSHIYELGFFFFYNPEDIVCAASTNIKQNQNLFISLNCTLSRKFSNPCLHNCVKECQASYLRYLSC